MGNSSMLCAAALTLALAMIVGCANGGAIALPKHSPNATDSFIAESQMTQDTGTRPLESPEFTATQVSTALARTPRQPALVTLATGDELTEMIDNAGGPVLLDFYADWCGPCRTQGKILHEMEDTAAKHQTLMIKINIDHHPEIARQLEVQSVPTLMMVKDGRVINRQSGVADASKLAEWMKTSVRNE